MEPTSILQMHPDQKRFYYFNSRTARKYFENNIFDFRKSFDIDSIYDSQINIEQPDNKNSNEYRFFI